MTKATGSDDVDLGRVLGTVIRAYSASAQGVASDVPGGPRGFQILSVAHGGACRNQAGIAQSLGIDRTVMTALVDGLESAGLVQRRPDPTDRRARQIVLTTAGRQVLASVTERVRQVEHELLAPLDAGEADELRRMLAKVAAPHATDAPVDPCHESVC